MHPNKLIRLLAVMTISLLMPTAALAHTSAKAAPALRHRAALRHGHRVYSRHTARAAAAGQTPTLLTPPVLIPAATGTTYYVSPSGSDSNSGTSPGAPWLTVTQVDRASLAAGDQVLFQGGATFSDNTLMPGWGVGASGTNAVPISFGSYGQGDATITQGVWFKSDNYLAFQNLILGSAGGITGTGFQGTGNSITIVNDTIQHVGIGINSMGNNWTIANNTINETGNSGMLLGFDSSKAGDPAGGSNYLVEGNTITNTGLDSAFGYGTHGIYLKVANATVINNTISHFRDDAISVRYRDNTIAGNHLSYGSIGIGWFQYDTSPGSSRWNNNTISHVSDAGIFVCGTREGCGEPMESFQISGNTITSYSGAVMNLQPTSGTYTLGKNTPRSTV